MDRARLRACVCSNRSSIKSSQACLVVSETPWRGRMCTQMARHIGCLRSTSITDCRHQSARRCISPRAASLASVGELSLSFGAIPFHHEQAGDDAEYLLSASRSCLNMAWYDAALDWSVRGRRMLSRAPRGKIYGDLTRNMLFALLLLGRHDDVAALCQDLLSRNEDPELLAHATYAMAILNARLYERCAGIMMRRNPGLQSHRSLPRPCLRRRRARLTPHS